MTRAKSHHAALTDRIKNGSAIVGIIGLGYVGLPLALHFCRPGFKVIGFDLDREKVDLLHGGRSYIRHVPAEPIAGLVAKGQFQATTDFGRLGEADCILICVPTPLTEKREPDLSYLLSTTETIKQHLRAGQLIVLESTTYPGTTDEMLLPRLETGGLKVGRDFFLAFSPEREDPAIKNTAPATPPR